MSKDPSGNPCPAVKEIGSIIKQAKEACAQSTSNINAQEAPTKMAEVGRDPAVRLDC